MMGAFVRKSLAWVALALTVLACASNGTNGSGPPFPYSGPSCSTGDEFSAACWSCVQSNCQALASCINGACSDYFMCFCICPDGSTDCTGSCATDIAPDCQSCLDGPACTACNGPCGTTSGDGGAPATPPDAFVAAQLGGGPECNLATPDTGWLVIGTATSSKPTTVTDQGSTGAGEVSVVCSVIPSGSDFAISLAAQVIGSGNASLTITGMVMADGATGVSATFFDSAHGAAYDAADCTLSTTYMGQPVPISPAIAAGRIWGHIDCPDAIQTGQPTGPDGGPTTIACAASADFLFENCSQ
jgi:hypothetical protein